MADITYSYYQHSLSPIDGDLPSLVAPSAAYTQVLNDPFGFKILQTGEKCAASNRFFFHWTTYQYFHHVPIWLQNFMSPIDSVYTSIALAKTIIQIGLIILLATYVSVTFGWDKNKWMLSAVILCPLFQANGFFEYMAVIDNSITYVFAYALWTLILLIFLYPIYRAAITNDHGLPIWLQPIWLMLAAILPFSGPLIAPILLIVCPSTLLFIFCMNWNKLSNLSIFKRTFASFYSINKKLLILFGLSGILAIYSLYIGSFNTENDWEVIPLLERYSRLFEGIWELFSFNEGVILVLMACLMNVFIINRSRTIDDNRLMKIFIFCALFIFLYILLLPVGGYRSYRPFIIRRDTLQPVLCILFFAWGISTVYILSYTSQIIRVIYSTMIVIVCVYFTYKDNIPTYTNLCEKESLQILASSSADCVYLPSKCTVLQWSNTAECAETIYSSKVLFLWNITPKETLYRHER